MNIVFMGTPDFAVPSLRALKDHHIQAVFCQPDRPRGRSGKPAPCPVKTAALEMGTPVHQPKRIRARKWVNLLRELSPDLIVVAAFGQILPQSILDIPTIDCVNVHASLLPRWRGASPIHHALLHGDEKAGVGIMKMELALDAGPVYSESAMIIPHTMGRVELESILAEMGADLLLQTLPHLAETTPVPQDTDLVTYAPIIGKNFGYVNFQEQTATDINNMVRAYEGWPAVHCKFQDVVMKLLKVAPGEETSQQPPGAVVEVGKKVLKVACAGGTVLQLLEIQPAGKKTQPIHAIVNGYKPEIGALFQSMD